MVIISYWAFCIFTERFEYTYKNNAKRISEISNVHVLVNYDLAIINYIRNSGNIFPGIKLFIIQWRQTIKLSFIPRINFQQELN